MHLTVLFIALVLFKFWLYYLYLLNCSRMNITTSFSFASVPSFASLSPETLAKFVDLLDEVHYEPGEYVIRQGARGDTFYIISNGQVQVTQNEKRKNDGAPATSLGRDAKENFVRLMGRGEWFGEKALKKYVVFLSEAHGYISFKVYNY